MDKEEYYPTVCFGFILVKDKTILHQMWVDQWGHSDWRPVPMVTLDKTRTPAAVGFVPDDEVPWDE